MLNDDQIQPVRLREQFHSVVEPPCCDGEQHEGASVVNQYLPCPFIIYT